MTSKEKNSSKNFKIHINKKIGKITLAKLLKNVSEITVAKSIYERMPQRYWEVIKNMGIKIKITTKKGRPKTPCIKNIEKLKAREIAKLLNISERTAYNLKKRCCKKCKQNIKNKKKKR